MIFGYSGSGKSTLAKKISEAYKLPILFLDKLIYSDNWKKRETSESIDLLYDFLKANNNWIIDGNGTHILFRERGKIADKIIFMDFNRMHCYKMAKARYKTYKNNHRESRPDNSNEKFDFSFKMWLLFGGRKKSRRKQFQSLINANMEKVIIIKNLVELQAFTDNMDRYLLR